MTTLSRLIAAFFLLFHSLSLNADTKIHATYEPSFKLIKTIPREAGHYTQGLVFGAGYLFESTGQYGHSAVIAYNQSDLNMARKYALPDDEFGEGITELGGKLYQLTWKSGKVLVYDLQLHLQKSLSIKGEGWGITTDGHALIISDGSDLLKFIDPETATLLRTVRVHSPSGKKWLNLNELEWINGVILANVWHLDTVLLIDPEDGTVIRQYNLEPLAQAATHTMKRRDSEQVLNGMAWDAERQSLFVTGKDWPLWFEIKLEPTPDISLKSGTP
jgi:glutamine cyclotransferase